MFWGFFAAGLGVLLLVAGGVFALKNRAPVVEVAVARPAGDPAQQTLLNASGYVTPRRRATVAAKITGRVTGVFFDEGNRAELLIRQWRIAIQAKQGSVISKCSSGTRRFNCIEQRN